MSNVKGSVTPRFYTPPLVTGPPGPCGCGCALTEATSFGFDVIEFTERALNHPPDPWQRWELIHAGELLPNGLPRFRIIVILVARQNGKTELLVMLSAFWQFVEAVPLIVGTSTKLSYAKESWSKVIKLVNKSHELAPLHEKKWYRNTNGEQESWTLEDSRYVIAASNEEGGRSLTIHRLIMDELRQHKSYAAWGAAVPATNAVPDAQVWCLSNAGDDQSIVLNEQRENCLDFIKWWNAESQHRTVEELLADPNIPGDFRTGLFEWSAPLGASPLDVNALAMANPNLGWRNPVEPLLGEARKAIKAGGKALATFKTEAMCIRVPMMDPAIDPEGWAECYVPGDLSQLLSRMAFFVDVAPDRQHATLAAAAMMPDGRARVGIAAAWSGVGAATNAINALAALVKEHKPQKFGYMPNGPAAVAIAALRKRKGRVPLFPTSTQVEEITDEVSAVCMGFAELVDARLVVHDNDDLLNDHVESSAKKWIGEVWRFERFGDGHCDATYAAAGAVHLARTLPKPIGKGWAAV